MELLVVLGILALTIAISVPALLGSNGSARLQPVSVQLAADLKSARVAAIVQSRPVSFVFNPSTRSYRVDGARAAVTLPKSIGLRLVTHNELVRTVEGSRLVFFPDGSSTGGQLTLFDQGRSITLQVTWLTGAVTLRGSAP